MAKVISIGNQSFESMRERDNFYVDKTSFIKLMTMLFICRKQMHLLRQSRLNNNRK